MKCKKEIVPQGHSKWYSMKLTLILRLAYRMFLKYAISLKGQDLVFIYNDMTFKPQETFSSIKKYGTWKKKKESQLNVIPNKLFYLLKKQQKLVEKIG